MNIINTLNTSNSSIDLLKISDTTLESSSCDDGNIILLNTFKYWNKTLYNVICINIFIYYVIIDTMVGSTIDAASLNEEREPSPQASIDK